MEPSIACEESWPWDELLNSPDQESFESASTAYDPPSIDSVPDSYNSSTSSEAALLPQPLWDPLTSHQTDMVAAPMQSIWPNHARAVPCSTALSQLPPKPPCPAAPAPRKMGQSTERRRVPRPRFRLSNQKATATCRNLLADLDAVEHVCDKDLHAYRVDYSSHASSLIKAHIDLDQQTGLEQWHSSRQECSWSNYEVCTTQAYRSERWCFLMCCLRRFQQLQCIHLQLDDELHRTKQTCENYIKIDATIQTSLSQCASSMLVLSVKYCVLCATVKEEDLPIDEHCKSKYHLFTAGTNQQWGKRFSTMAGARFISRRDVCNGGHAHPKGATTKQI